VDNLTTNTPPEVYSETMTEIETTINEAIEGGWIPCRYITEFTHDLKKGLLCDGEIAQALLDPKFWQAVWKTRGGLTILPSVEEVEKRMGHTSNHCEKGRCFGACNTDIWVDLLTQDRNQAYTSLVEGIEGMEAPEFSEYDLEALHEGFFLALEHIIENVVKPLYGKE